MADAASSRSAAIHVSRLVVKMAGELEQDLDAVYAFVKAVRAGSFSAAAFELGVTPSAISRKVAKLEQQLGVQLLQRTTRKFTLTQVGRDFFNECEEGISCIQRAEENVAFARAEARGLLRVNVPQGFGRLHVAPLVMEILAAHPSLVVDLVFGAKPDFADTTIDIVIGSADPSNTNMVVRRLMKFRRITCAAPSYLSQHSQPQSVTDLARHNCLIFTASDSVDDEWAYPHQNGTRTVKISGNFRTNNLDAMRAAVRGGLGIAHMPSYLVAEDLKEGKLIELLGDHHKPSSQDACMMAYYASAKHRLPKVTVFLDHLMKSFE